MFISFLCIFQANMCPLSGEITISTGHLEFVTETSGQFKMTRAYVIK
jgi:hypothetical protein